MLTQQATIAVMSCRCRYKAYSWHLCMVAFASLLMGSSIPSHATSCESAPQSRAPVKAVCGKVRDIAGASLSGADISLVREDGSVAATIKAQDGKFDLSPVAKGDYFLRVEQPGFPTYGRNITVTRDRVTSCKSTVRVKLSPLACGSSIRVRGIDK